MSVALNVNWDLLTVLYFFFSGVSIGGTILACLSLVFGYEKLRPLAGLSLITGLVFGFATILSILPHLAQPSRWWTLATVFQTSSPMSWGVWILIIYLLTIMVGGRYAYKSALIDAYNKAKGVSKMVYRILLIGTTEVTPESEKRNSTIVKVFLGVAFFASLLFVYQGFEIGVLAGRPLWFSPTTPLLMLITAIYSGFAFVTFSWLVFNFGEPRREMLSDISKMMFVLLLSFVGLNVGEYLVSLGADVYRRLAISALFVGVNFYYFVIGGVVIGAVVPALLLVIQLLRGGVVSLLISSLLMLVGVFVTKLALIMAGQMFAKYPVLPPSLTQTLMSTTEMQLGLGVIALTILLYLAGVWIIPWRYYKGGV